MGVEQRLPTIESVSSSTRIEGARLTDREVEKLLANIRLGSFTTRDEQEVAGYVEVMETQPSWKSDSVHSKLP